MFPEKPTKVVGKGANGAWLTESEIQEIVVETLSDLPLVGKKGLLIVPDATRTAPIGVMFRVLHNALTERGATLDVMIALGTHPAMSEDAICRRLEITATERHKLYNSVRFLNHSWDKPESLTQIGVIPAGEITFLTGGAFAEAVPVAINRAIFEYDRLILVGPTFPHEVAGFSGGNKYLFPGISGPEILNFFHWLGAVITNPAIIGQKWTPVRRVIDRAASFVPVPVTAFCLCVGVDGTLAGLYAGDPVAAWSRAADLSDELHVVYKEHPFSTVLSCAPPMYDDLWVGGKCMYKLEPVVADGGELIIYAPHIHEVSPVHGASILRIGYHVRDYFLQQWDRFGQEPWGVLAHSTHVRGVGTFADGVESPRVQVTLATGIAESVCDQINLGYRDPLSIRVADYADREDEGVLLVPKAGERLYRLRA